MTRVHISRGPSFEVSTSTSFTIMPDNDSATKFATSQVIRETVCKVLRPSDYALKVRKVTNARNNGIRIEAIFPDIEKIKAHPNLAQAGLNVIENTKANPRLIIYGVTSEMSSEKIRNELIAQNLNGDNNVDLKVIYIYQPKDNKRYTSCVIEVTPEVQRRLLKNERIYLRFSACNFADHVRVLQCYKCMTFGHIAQNCKLDPICGHCSRPHEMINCNNRKLPPLCCNCTRYSKGDLRVFYTCE